MRVWEESGRGEWERRVGEEMRVGDESVGGECGR